MALRVRHSLLVAASAVLAGAGCFPPDEGIAPPLQRLYFPVALQVSPAPTPSRLYVANSNFDLQFNAGTLQAYDLDRLEAFLPVYCEADADCPGGEVCDLPNRPTNRGAPSHWCVDREAPNPCGLLGEKTAAERLIAPGRCAFLDPVSPPDGGEPVLVDSVTIGAFATDMIVRQSPEPDARQARLFIPVRGDATLHWIEVRDDSRVIDDEDVPELECGQGAGTACSANFRRGGDPAAENTRDLDLPPEPFGVAATGDGRAVIVTHQTSGAVSLFVNDWTSGAAGGPRLEFIESGLPLGAVAAAALPQPSLVTEGFALQAPGFFVVFRTSPEIRLARFLDDRLAAPARPFLEASRFTQITALSQGNQSRGIAVDDADRRRCERECPEGSREACLAECIRRAPLDVYVTNRAPAALLIGETRTIEGVPPLDDVPFFQETIALEPGPSRAIVGDVKGPDGEPSRRVFAVCFDARKIYVYDPSARRLELIIRTGRGPHSIALDPARGLGYIAHFTDSYIGVVDLDRAHRTYGQMIATLGPPTPPRASE